MKRILVLTLALSIGSVGLVGCAQQEAGTKTEKTTTTPGGETKVTTETKVEKEGENPP